MPNIVVVTHSISFLQSLNRETTLFDLLYRVWSMDAQEFGRLLCNSAVWPEGWSLENERQEMSLEIQDWQDVLGKHATIADVLNCIKLNTTA